MNCTGDIRPGGSLLVAAGILFLTTSPAFVIPILGSEEPFPGVPNLPLTPLPAGLNSLMPVPLDNPLTIGKINLGRRLFFDKKLSRDGTISCATCHHPDKAFTDGRALPIGIDGSQGRRNVPSLLNSAYGKSYFWDGRVSTLEKQALIPLTSPHEMGNTLEAVIAMLDVDPSYRRQFKSVFGSEQIAAEHVTRALASYQRTLVAADVPYDHYVLSDKESALSVAARKGLELFRGKARCGHCHEGTLFTDEEFHNTGVRWGIEPLDLGRYEHTGRDGDKGKFKTPSLRNLRQTAPYMHDGSLTTLEDVVEFYNRGGRPNPYLDPSLQPLVLTAGEVADLVEFLLSLSGPFPSQSP